MRKYIRLVCMALAIVLLFAIPARAEIADVRASAYFTAYDSYLWKASGTTFQIWFDVIARNYMEELGVSSIEVQRSLDGGSWTTMRTYSPGTYPQMISENAVDHVGYVSYTGTSGYYYRAVVTFYAKNSNGTAYRVDYAETIKY